MKKKTFSKEKMYRFITIMVLIAILNLQILPTNIAFGYPVEVVVDGSFTSISQMIDQNMLRVKSYVLDTLAYSIASIMLQEVTTSVVNWINNGFNGNPSFLTNPESFFMDIGDQITGNFISETGILSGLCTPFNIDIRLALALGQAAPYKRYTCTLSTIIDNVGNSTINGTSINGFMNGDFRQGGWPAFITMVSDPQNNAPGAYLTAQSDLLQRIGVTQTRYKEDLIQGSGFLSYKKCKDITADQLASQREYDEEIMGDDYSKLNNKGNQTLSLGNDTYTGAALTVEKKVKGDKTTYQNCSTETPGSVIGGAINKSLGIPQDRLNLASSFNQIVNALFASLITRVLYGGLRSASSPGSGNLGGIATQLAQQSQNEQLTKLKEQLRTSINTYYATTMEYLQLRQQALDSIASVKNQYLSAKACFDSKVGSTTSIRNLSSSDISYARSQMASIDTAIALNIAPLEKTYQEKMDDSKKRSEYINKILNGVDTISNVNNMKEISDEFSTAVQGGSKDQTAPGAIPPITTLVDKMNAQNDLETLKGQLETLTTNANDYSKSCLAFPNRQ